MLRHCGIAILLGALVVGGVSGSAKNFELLIPSPTKTGGVFLPKHVLVANATVEPDRSISVFNSSEPGKPRRIVSDPLRFEGEFSINLRFFCVLMLVPLSLFFCVWGGQYLYRQRRLIGAALIGCGGLYVLLAFWLTALGGRL